ncbi:MAG: flagellar basal-body rod protein FlgG [Phycisphaerales bacterium]
MAYIALQSASTGLSALSTNLDVIANNLANVNTDGFRASRVNFEDLMYQQRAMPGVENVDGERKPTGLFVGLGVRVSGTQFNLTNGSPISTGNPLDLTIEGRGFFQVLVEDDRAENGIAYTRAGNFTVNSEGDLVLGTSEGRLLEPNINIPDGVQSISVGATGIVSGTIAGDAEPTEFGQIQLADFTNPGGLIPLGENLFAESAGSGAAIENVPGDDGIGRLISGFIESSNVDATTELVKLIRTQRAFEMNSQTIRAADEALQTLSQLRR